MRQTAQLLLFGREMVAIPGPFECGCPTADGTRCPIIRHWVGLASSCFNPLVIVLGCCFYIVDLFHSDFVHLFAFSFLHFAIDQLFERSPATLSF